jgi:hypothetical protein
MATGDRPVYGMDVFDVLDKRQRLRFQPPAPAKDVDLEAYAGKYSAQPWHSEVAIVPWGMGLAALWLPSTDPAEDIEVLSPRAATCFGGCVQMAVRPTKCVLSATTRGAYIDSWSSAIHTTAWRRCHLASQTNSEG